MAVPDDFFLFGVIHEFHFTHDFFRLAPLGNPVFFLRNVDIVFDPRIRQLHSPGGVSTPKAKKNRFIQRPQKKQSVCGRYIQRPQKSSQCVDVKYLTSTSAHPVCDLVLCDLVLETALYSKERLFPPPPTGPNPLCHRDD